MLGVYAGMGGRGGRAVGILFHLTQPQVLSLQPSSPPQPCLSFQGQPERVSVNSRQTLGGQAPCCSRAPLVCVPLFSNVS